MESSEKELSLPTKFGCSKVAALVNNLEECHISTLQNQSKLATKKVGPAPPPKPHKKTVNSPEVPQSSVVKQVCEPLYSKRLQSTENCLSKNFGSSSIKINHNLSDERSILQRKQPLYATRSGLYEARTITLDNPAILEQQLEALAHHKKQLEKKGLLLHQNEQQKPLEGVIPKLSTKSLVNNKSKIGYNVYSNVSIAKNKCFNEVWEHKKPNQILSTVATNSIYCNVPYDKNSSVDTILPPPPPAVFSCEPVDSNIYVGHSHESEDDIPQPPSPVSSSYSELRRAIDVFSKNPATSSQQNIENLNNKETQFAHYGDIVTTVDKSHLQDNNQQTYMNMNYNNDYSGYSPTMPSVSQDSSDFYGYGSFSQASSTYESIYEPINPRPPSQLSTRSNFLMHAPYANSPSVDSGSNSGILNSNLAINNFGSINSGRHNNAGKIKTNIQKEADVEALNDFLVHSMDAGNDADSYGICFKCDERVFGENSGCTAMNQIYHIACFTCCQCQINLQGKPFYALEGKPFCEYDYLQTLEKCSVCMKPILERILRATGKPYHPQCFTCCCCGKSLDGIPFTVDATNQNYCIADFHKKFAPRCCVCKEPIMPEPGEEETVRVVALDRSFHFECYKCEDCCLLLSSEAEGRGCYPLDDHVLCKSCNAKRVQMLTNRMTTEL